MMATVPLKTIALREHRMIGAIAKYVGGRTLTAVLGVSAILIIIWYWRLPLEARAELWSAARGVLIWMGFVAVLPWATFFIPPRVVRAESNLVSGLALLGYLTADVLFALYLTGGSFGNQWQTGLMLIGFLCAAVYNFVVCEFLAERSEESV
jgi:hypothetical protein